METQSKLLSTPENNSLAELLASLPESLRAEALAGIPESACAKLLHDWRGFWARPNQLRPGTPGSSDPRSDWRYWLLQGGRGSGKTRTGGETVREWVDEGRKIIHMIAPTAGDVRDVMIEGPGGLLSCYPRNDKPTYHSTRNMVTWANGAVAHTFSAEEPDRLRGPQCEVVWGDEIAAWRYGIETWDQMNFGLRLGNDPRGVFTSTPKPVPLFQQVVKHPNTVITRASTYENRRHLAAGFFADIITKYEGTRLGRQELLAELLEDIPGALWTQALIDAGKIPYGSIRWDLLVRIVVAIDPAVTAGEESDETGIIVAALTVSGHVVVLDDLSCRESPLGWARIAIAAYRTRQADRIVAEVNNGGDLVGANILAAAPDVSFRAVRASRGKAVRAEPVANLYEQGRVHHAIYPRAGQVPDRFEELERQMCSYVPGITTKSPDRMDALVWAITELVIDREEIRGTLLQPLIEISPI